MPGNQWYVDIARLADRFAIVQCFQPRKVVGVTLDQQRELLQKAATVQRTHILPC